MSNRALACAYDLALILIMIYLPFDVFLFDGTCSMLRYGFIRCHSNLNVFCAVNALLLELNSHRECNGHEYTSSTHVLFIAPSPSPSLCLSFSRLNV